MNSYMRLGSVPSAEPRADIKDIDYVTKAQIECAGFKEQLERTLKDELPPESMFTIKNFPHDYGNLIEVALLYSHAHAEKILELVKKLPTHWDEEALLVLEREGLQLKKVLK